MSKKGAMLTNKLKLQNLDVKETSPNLREMTYLSSTLRRWKARDLCVEACKVNLKNLSTK